MWEVADAVAMCDQRATGVGCRRHRHARHRLGQASRFRVWGLTSRTPLDRALPPQHRRSRKGAEQYRRRESLADWGASSCSDPSQATAGEKRELRRDRV